MSAMLPKTYFITAHRRSSACPAPRPVVSTRPGKDSTAMNERCPTKTYVFDFQNGLHQLEAELCDLRR